MFLILFSPWGKIPTVDGRNPKLPPGKSKKKLVNIGNKLPFPQLVSLPDFFHQQYFAHFFRNCLTSNYRSVIEKIGNDYDRNLSPGCAGVIRRGGNIRVKQLSCFVGRFVLGFKVLGKHRKAP